MPTPTKAQLFGAVADEFGAQLDSSISRAVLVGDDPWDRTSRAIDACLDECIKSEIQRTLYIDGPAVGWDEWRQGSRRHTSEMLKAALRELAAGQLGSAEIDVLADRLVGAVGERHS